MSDKKHLLIIDDEVDLCRLLEIRFRKCGLEVSIAHDGKSGFQKVLEVMPDTVLLDIRMTEGGDGLTFLRKLKGYRHEDAKKQEQVRQTSVIVLSASDRMKDLFLNEGVKDFVTKPYDPDDLRERVLLVTGARK